MIGLLAKKRESARRRNIGQVCSFLSHRHPTALAMTCQDGFADEELVMPVFETGEARLIESLGLDGIVKVDEQLFEGVGKTLIMPAGISDRSPRTITDQGWIADQRLVGLIPSSDPQFVGRLTVPGKRLVRAGQLEAKTILSSGGDL